MVMRNRMSVVGAAVIAVLALTIPSAEAASTPPAGFLPNAKRTPGATNGAVTQATIYRTICVRGYTTRIRPPESYTYALKRNQLASGYAYHGIMSTSFYEEDHLIALELGGAPRDPKNLWPEPYAGPYGAHVKDKLENRLHVLVCNGSMALRTAQHLIATNWYAAYLRYG